MTLGLFAAISLGTLVVLGLVCSALWNGAIYEDCEVPKGGLDK